jgi:GDP-L-fucose synthase
MPTNLYGPGDNYDPTGSHVLPAMIRRFQEATDQNLKRVTCWGSGTPLREFLHADDLGSACLFALENWDPSHSSAPKDDQGKPLAFLNVGTGFDLSIRELAEQVARIVGYKGSIEWDASKPDGTPKKQLNVSRLSNLGWAPKISLERGLPLAIEDFRQRRSTGLLRS